MPSRTVCAVIVLFWLAAIGWMFYREWLPWLTADKEAPPFVFELADEVVTQHASWQLFRNGKRIGSARSMLRFQRDNTFEWTTSLNQLDYEAKFSQLSFKAHIPTLLTKSIVTPKGELIRFTTTGELQMSLLLTDLTARVEVSSEVQGDNMLGTCTLQSPLGELRVPFGPIQLQSKNVFSPMQPLFRISGLVPGRSWRMNDFDPLGEAFRAAFKQVLENVAKIDNGKGKLPIELPVSKSNSLLAEVSREIQTLEWRDQTYRCYIIEYRSDSGPTAKTWVGISDGRVLRQEATGYGESLILQRD